MGEVAKSPGILGRGAASWWASVARRAAPWASSLRLSANQAQRGAGRALSAASRAVAASAARVAQGAVSAAHWSRGRLAPALGPGVAALASVSAGGLAYGLTGSRASAIDAGAWVLVFSLLFSMRAAQRRQAAALERELNELKQLLHVTQALIQVEELEGAEEVGESLHGQDADTAEREPGANPFAAWRRRFGLRRRS